MVELAKLQVIVDLLLQCPADHTKLKSRLNLSAASSMQLNKVLVCYNEIWPARPYGNDD